MVVDRILGNRIVGVHQASMFVFERRRTQRRKLDLLYGTFNPFECGNKTENYTCRRFYAFGRRRCGFTH